MSKITITAGTIGEYHGSGTPAEARLQAFSTFTTSNGTVVAHGRAWYQAFAVSGVDTDGVVSLVQGDAYATTDSTDQPSTAAYKLALYDSNGNKLTTIYPYLRISSLVTPTTWEAIRVYSAAIPVPAAAPSYLNADQVETLIGQISGGGGEVSLTHTYGNSLSAAISSIGSSPLTLLVDTDTSVSSSLTIPATLTLQFTNKAKITLSGSGAIVFQGIGIAGDPDDQIVSGATASNLSWANVRPAMRPEWFGCKADGATDCTAAVTTILSILNNQNTAGRGGGLILFRSGVYLFNSMLGSDAVTYRSVTLKGEGGKPGGFGALGPTVFKSTVTGSGAAYNVKGVSIQYIGISLTYSSTSFTGTLVDLGPATGLVDGNNALIRDCYVGGYWTSSSPVVPMTATDLIRLGAQIEAIVEHNAIMGGVNGIRLDLPGNGTDTNVIKVVDNSFNLLGGSGILNPAQTTLIENNNFETLNFASVFGSNPTPNGAMPWAINFDDYDATSRPSYGTNIIGNWFGDRVGSGGGYIRLGRTVGANIAGNFFGGGYNSVIDYGANASGANTGTTLTLAGANFTTTDIGKRVFINSQNWSGVITAILSTTTATVDTAFTGTFSAADVLLSTSQVREYKGAVIGLIHQSQLTVGNSITLPTDIWGRKVWIDGTFVGKVASRTPFGGDTSFFLDRNLTSTYAGSDMQIGEWRYNASAIQIAFGSRASIHGNTFGGGMHAIDAQEDTLFDLTDLSVTNGSNVVTRPDGDISKGQLLGWRFAAATGIPAEGWSVPGGTTITDVSTDGKTITLSNNVTVSSGQNPRRATVKNYFSGGSAFHIAGNVMPGGISDVAQVANPFTGSKTKSLYSSNGQGDHVQVGNGYTDGYSHDFINRNWGLGTESFADGVGIMAVGRARTVPTTNPDSGTLLVYGDSGKLKMRDTNGIVSTIGLDTATTRSISDAFSGNVDDYAMGGQLPKLVRIYASTSALNELRGLKPAGSLTVPEGTQVLFINVGSTAFVVKNAAGTSTVGYRFTTSTGGDLTIGQNQSVEFIYMPQDSGWYAR